jgi:hypothetical protein
VSDYSIRNGIPVRAGGRIVGSVIDGKFCKRVRGSKHMLREPRGWAIDVQSLTDAERLGAREVEIHDSESDVIYTASVERIRSKGLKFDRGFGQQVCLPLQSWAVHPLGEPRQLSLALGVMA